MCEPWSQKVLPWNFPASWASMCMHEIDRLLNGTKGTVNVSDLVEFCPLFECYQKVGRGQYFQELLNFNVHNGFYGWN
jgi:hypothetical protein